jgi:hypothetical protein
MESLGVVELQQEARLLGIGGKVAVDAGPDVAEAFRRRGALVDYRDGGAGRSACAPAGRC